MVRRLQFVGTSLTWFRQFAELKNTFIYPPALAQHCYLRTSCHQTRSWFYTLTFLHYNIIVVTMIPEFIQLPGAPWPVLPAGIHKVELSEVERRLATNGKRRDLFDGLLLACRELNAAGCEQLYLDGSYVTDKPIPGDFDAAWHPVGVSATRLDPVFKDFSNGRAAQKAKYGGEFFPSTTRADSKGNTFVEFFQIEKFTELPKGVLLIDLSNDPLLKPKVTP